MKEFPFSFLIQGAPGGRGQVQGQPKWPLTNLPTYLKKRFKKNQYLFIL